MGILPMNLTHSVRIPSLLFIPKEGQPQMAMGALPKETFKQAISEVLSVSE